MEEEILVGWLEPGATSSESWTLGLNNKYWVFFWTMLANDIYILKKKKNMIQQMFDDVIRTKGTWTMNITHFFSNHFWAVSCCVNVPWCLFLKRSSIDPTTPAGIFLSQIPNCLGYPPVCNYLALGSTLSLSFLDIPTALVCLLYPPFRCLSLPFAVDWRRFTGITDPLRLLRPHLLRGSGHIIRASVH